jgi:hypothetical protein
MSLMKWALLSTFATVLVACGGTDNAGTPIFGGGASGASGAAATASNLTLQLSTSSIVNSGAKTVTATATATTAAGEALAGIPVTFSVDSNATFTQSSATTGSDGTSTAVVSIGADPSNRIITITATSGTLTTSAPFAVTGATLNGTASPAVTTPGATGNQVIFTLTNTNSNPMTGQTITVTAGSLGTTTGTTDINGKYTYAYTAPSTAQTLNIVAVAGGTTDTQTVLVQSTGSGTVPPAVGPIQSASVSANPSVVSTNTTASNNETQIRALFVGPNNAPIQNVRVLFDLNGDANSVGGTFATGTNVVYSDANGAATTSYIPGSRSSPTDGLTIRACYSTTDIPAGTCPNSALTTVTVVSDPLSVSIGSNGLIAVGPSGLTYIRQFVVLVVDASGNAKGNVTIVPSIDLDYYYKGQYVNPGAWFPGIVVPNVVPPQNLAVPPFRCLAEDLNRNGVLETGEDINHSGSLEPRKSDATITILGGGQTDSHGSAVVQVEYLQNVGSWLHVNILVSATGVSGTEGRAIWSEVLPVPIGALSATASPPFQFSPYGIDISGNPILPGDGRLTLDSFGQHTLFPDGTVPPAGPIDPCHNPY